MFGAIKNNVSGLLAAKARFTDASGKVNKANIDAANAFSKSGSASTVAGSKSTSVSNPKSSQNIKSTSSGTSKSVNSSKSGDVGGSKGTASAPKTAGNQKSLSASTLVMYDPASPLANSDGYLTVPGEKSSGLIVEVAEMSRAAHAYKANAAAIKSLNQTMTNFLREVK